MWNLIISPQEYRKTLQELLNLQIWYACESAKIEKRSLAETINQYTEIYYYSTEYKADIPADKNSEWQKIVGSIINNKKSYWEILSPYILPRINKDLLAAKQDIESSFYGFMYEFYPEYNSESNADFLTIHFRNYFAPESPFEHYDELKQGLLQIIEKVQAERPDVKQVQCASWLNNLSKFTVLFPEQWLKRANDCYPMSASTGWWGKFINRKGLINQMAVMELKATKTFSTPNRHCRCTIDELHQHLSQ